MNVSIIYISHVAVLLVTQVKSQELNSTLFSTPFGVPTAFVNETVEFTCVIKGSDTVGWISDQYIGLNRQLIFISTNPEGTQRTRDAAVAELISTSNGVLVTTLRIKIQPTSESPIASVQCNNIGDNTETFIAFRLAGKLIALYSHYAYNH